MCMCVCACKDRRKWRCSASWWKEGRTTWYSISVMLKKSMLIKCTLQQGCGTGSVWAYGLWKRMAAPGRWTPCDGLCFTQSWKDSGKALEGDQQGLNSLSLPLQREGPSDYRPTFFMLGAHLWLIWVKHQCETTGLGIKLINTVGSDPSQQQYIEVESHPILDLSNICFLDSLKQSSGVI